MLLSLLYEKQNMKYISMFNGVCFNIEETIKLDIALNELHLNQKTDEMWLWGKIIGLEKDYYIAMGIFFTEKYQFPEKRFYWCSSTNFVFSPLDESEDYHLKECQKFNTYFTGNQDVPLTILVKEEEGGEGAVKKDEEVPKKEEDPDITQELIVEAVKLKNFTELHRLGFVVRMIDRETAVVPEGAFKMLPIHEMRRNDNFQGLKNNDLGNLGKYMHFRDVMSQEKKEFIQRDDAIFSFNFLDSIDKDNVKGSWSLQLDSTKTISSIRSLLWPGYFAFHKANSKAFGSIYIGFGIRNTEFSFMI